MSNCIMEVRNLKKYFKVGGGMLHAVDGISFKINEGETLGIVGESGCGKSTLGRTVLRLHEPTSGEIIYNGQDISKLSSKEFDKIRPNIQMIFQDPYSSINPRMTVERIIAEPMLIHKKFNTKQEVYKRVDELMEIVGLSSRFTTAYPHELDGGRRQRIGVARALSLDPKFIVCDEPVSALDVSVQAQVLNLLMDLQEQLKLTYIFITHDMSVVKHISNNIAVMYLGQNVETCTSDELFENPLHPYTKALLSAIPVPDLSMKQRKMEVIKGEITNPINPKPGCRFMARCPHACDKCAQPQEFREVESGHFVACHMV